MFICTVSTVRYLYLNVEENVSMRIAVAWCVTEELSTTRIGVTVLYPRVFLRMVNRYVLLIILVLTYVMLSSALWYYVLLVQHHVHNFLASVMILLQTPHCIMGCSTPTTSLPASLYSS